MLIEFVKTDYEFEDDRGLLVQLFHDGFKQVNVIVCKKDSVRGGHYHKDNDELFFVVSGGFTLELVRGEDKEKYEIKAGDFFKVKPLISHTFYYTEDTILVSAYSLGVEHPDGSKDIFRV